MLDPIDHPIIYILIINLGVLGVVFGILTLMYYVEGADNPYNYKYTDIDGNEGFAQWCNQDGGLNCYRNGGYVQVKEFRKNV